MKKRQFAALILLLGSIAIPEFAGAYDIPEKIVKIISGSFFICGFVTALFALSEEN